MAFTHPWFEVAFGQGYTGLTLVGYRLYKNDGTDAVARSTTGVIEVGYGVYGVANISVPDEAVGIEWDMGEAPDIHAVESIEELRQHDSNALEVAGAVWDEVLTGATHNTPTSAGRRMRELAGYVVFAGIAVGSGNGVNQIELDTDASALDGAYDPALISIVEGTGAGQSRLVLQYDGATRIATVDRNWKIEPNATSEFVITGAAGREHVNEGLAQGGTINTITLNALGSDDDDVYIGQRVFIRSGKGEDQSGVIKSYNGTTKVATMWENWIVTPDSTTGYAMIPDKILMPESVATAILDAALSSHEVSGSIGEAIGLLLDVEDGRWDIVSNQMIFYKADNVTEVMRFNLFDISGNPTMEEVTERRRVA
jgi:hypothetical protein